MLTIVTTTRVTTSDAELASHLRIAEMRLSRRLRQQRTSEGQTASQLSALATLDRSGPLTLGELATAERVQPPSATRIVASLEAEGLVARTAHPTDGRQVLLAVTPLGARLLNADRKRRDAWLAQRLRDLDPADLAALHAAAAVLERLATE